MKRKTIIGRMMAVMLILLLIFQIGGVGVLTAFARVHNKEYQSGERVYVGDLEVGDVLDEGVILYVDLSGNANTLDDASLILNSQGMESKEGWAAYNGNFHKSLDKNRVEHTLEDKLTVTELETSPYTKNRIAIYLNFYSERDAIVAMGVTNEEELIAALDLDETIVLANSIELSDCFYVKDGKEHTLDLNGYTLSRKLQSMVATGHVLQVNAGSKLTIIDECDDETGMITGGWANNAGGAFVAGELVLEDVIFTENKANNGGAIYVKGGSVTINNGVVIEQNSASSYGGGIYNTGGSVTINKGVVIEENEAFYGGGIYNEKTLVIDGCVIENNKASFVGGGICNRPDSTLEVKNSTITLNTAEDWGGGISNSGTATLKSTEITHNMNTRNGAGIDNMKDLTLEDCEIAGNSCSESGGGIMSSGSSTLTFIGNNRIGENYAKTGGGVYATAAKLELDHVTIENNTATSFGGGIYYSGKMVLKDVKISGNAGGDSAKNAGGIYMSSGSIELAGGKPIISSNTGSNTNSNIVFAGNSKIYVTGELKNGSSVGVTLPTGIFDTYDITDGYKTYNTMYPNQIFFSDTQDYRVEQDKDNKLPEVRYVKRPQATANSYTLKVTVKVTDDADYWDYAFLYIYGRDNNGQSSEQYLTCSPDFKESIDHSDGYYEYNLDCGKAFPSTVKFQTMYGTGGAWRDFEADVKVYINGVNCAYAHCVHNVYGVEKKETSIKISGDKYPYPDIDIDQRAFIDPTDPASGIVSIKAVDQYGLAWSTVNNSYKIQNLSFEENDFAEDVGNGLKWKMSTNWESDHFSEYLLTFYSASNVYREITNKITVHFAYPMQLTVVVDDEIVYRTTGTANSRITIQEYPCKEGYYIYSYKADGTSYFLEKNDDEKTYTFAFGKEDITLTAVTKGIRYYVEFNKNAEDATKTMKSKAMNYDKEAPLGKNCYKRAGYVFAGWNTMPDGSGTAYADNETVKNLTSVAAASVTLYAQWQPEDPGVTASIFSDGTFAIYIGGAVILLSLIGIAIYMIKKKRSKQS